jgi:hypothetical protein
MTGTPELQAAEEIYGFFERVNFFLNIALSKRAVVSGGASLPSSVVLFDSKT